MDPERFDQLTTALHAVGSRRRLLGGGIAGAVAALGARLGLARAQTCDCPPGFDCIDGLCDPIGSIHCAPPLFPCDDDPGTCCFFPIPDPCENCQAHEICIPGVGCLGFLGPEDLRPG